MNKYCMKSEYQDKRHANFISPFLARSSAMVAPFNEDRDCEAFSINIGSGEEQKWRLQRPLYEGVDIISWTKEPETRSPADGLCNLRYRLFVHLRGKYYMEYNVGRIGGGIFSVRWVSSKLIQRFGFYHERRYVGRSQCYFFSDSSDNNQWINWILQNSCNIVAELLNSPSNQNRFAWFRGGYDAINPPLSFESFFQFFYLKV